MKQRSKAFAEYIIVFLVVLIAFVLCHRLGIKNDETKTRMLARIALLCTAAYAVFVTAKKEMTAKKAVSFIVIAGIIVRISYMIYTHMFTRGHDLGQFSTADTGHLSYIMNLVVNRSLPATNDYQGYHPPLFHLLAALFIKVGMIFNDGSVESAFECSQIINCTASCFMLLAFKNFLDEIGIDEKYQPYTAAVVAFFPNFYLMGGRLNNDMLVSYFMLLCVINTYRWYRRRDLTSAAFLGLSFGLGMMAKVSCGTMAIFTAPVMLYVLYKDFKAKNVKNTVLQLAVFAVICFPLALWYPLRNYILFEQPLNFVHYLGTGSFVYTGDVPLFKRLFEISIPKLVSQPFANVADDYSVPMHVLRTSIFGEFSYEGFTAMYSAFSVINLILVCASVASMVFVSVKGKSISSENRLGILFVWAITVISFTAFNISYPFICTADFRYIPLTAVTGAVFIGYSAMLLEGMDKSYHADKLLLAMKALVFIWCAFSCLLFV